MSSNTSLRDLHLHPPYTREKKIEYLEKCLPLYKSTLTGDWETAQRIINDDQNIVNALITEGGETALQIAAAGKNIEFVQKLISKMNNWWIMNKRGNTALCFAAAKGNLQIVELMINENHNLKPPSDTNICGPDGVKPIYMAASLGHGEIVNSLYNPSDFINWPIEERADILTACIASGLFDVAQTMIKDDNTLLILENRHKETTLDVLVRLSSEFDDDDEKPNCSRSCKTLLKFILDILFDTDNEEISNLISKCPVLVLEAAKLGNMEFLVILLQRFPDLIWTADSHLNRNIFHMAILSRHLGIFNLIYELDSIRSFLVCKMDDDQNNMLHLAAKLAPQHQLDMVSGAAFQMQRELLWFKAVKAIVQPSYRNMKNNNNKTPAEIFEKEHETLMVKGERWMIETAKASMMVSTIIASVVFTSIFTVPGGSNNDTGVPILSRRPFMKVFYISEIIALLSSFTAIFMFLAILTSRYAQSDFLRSLPLKLMIGIAALILSLGAMVLAFCSAIILSYHCGFPWICFLLGVFSFVPLLYLTVKLHLLRDVICSTYDAQAMFRPRNRLFKKE